MATDALTVLFCIQSPTSFTLKPVFDTLGQYNTTQANIYNYCNSLK